MPTAWVPLAPRVKELTCMCHCTGIASATHPTTGTPTTMHECSFSPSEVVQLLRYLIGQTCAKKVTFVLSAVSHKLCVALITHRQHGGHCECKPIGTNKKPSSELFLLARVIPAGRRLDNDSRMTIMPRSWSGKSTSLTEL